MSNNQKNAQKNKNHGWVTEKRPPKIVMELLKSHPTKKIFKFCLFTAGKCQKTLEN